MPKSVEECLFLKDYVPRDMLYGGTPQRIRKICKLNPKGDGCKDTKDCPYLKTFKDAYGFGLGLECYKKGGNKC